MLRSWFWRQIRPPKQHEGGLRVGNGRIHSVSARFSRFPVDDGHNKMPSESEVPEKIQKIEDLTPNLKSEDGIKLLFSKLTPNAFTPTRGSTGAAGYDLYSAYDYVVPGQGKTVALTDLQIALPDGCYGRVAPRSGLAAKHFIDVGAGVVDQDYRGNVGVVLFNFSQTEFEIKKGDRIAQLILERIFIPDLVEVSNLDSTDRGSGGFGSTGKS